MSFRAYRLAPFPLPAVAVAVARRSRSTHASAGHAGFVAANANADAASVSHSPPRRSFAFLPSSRSDVRQLGSSSHPSAYSNPAVSTMSAVQPGSLLGMGNPLLDISTVVKKELLDKYSLKPNDAILYEKEDLYDELKKDYGDAIDYIAGGATQNSMRVAQWILGTAKATAFFGCVGKDDTSATLSKCAESAGVDVKYQYSSEHPTGKCAVLITGQERSLVTKLDAANHFTVDHLEPNWSMVEKAKAYYSSGFFLTVSPESMLKVAQHAVDNGKIFAMNLSAPFLPQFFSEPMEKVMALSAIVFGNETEAEAFSEKHGYGTKNIREIAEKMAQIPLQGKVKRTVIITQGADAVIAVHDGKTKEYPVEKLEADQIVDTNGAGDAFVGGYLAQLVLGKDMDTCVRCGIWAGTKIIQRSGCSVPDKMDFN